MFFWSGTHYFRWPNHDFWMNSKNAVISAQSIVYISCNAKAGRSLGHWAKLPPSVPAVPQFGKEYEGSSCNRQTWISHYQWLSIQVSAKTRELFLHSFTTFSTDISFWGIIPTLEAFLKVFDSQLSFWNQQFAAQTHKWFENLCPISSVTATKIIITVSPDTHTWRHREFKIWYGD